MISDKQSIAFSPFRQMHIRILSGYLLFALIFEALLGDVNTISLYKYFSLQRIAEIFLGISAKRQNLQEGF